MWPQRNNQPELQGHAQPPSQPQGVQPQLHAVQPPYQFTAPSIAHAQSLMMQTPLQQYPTQFLANTVTPTMPTAPLYHVATSAATAFSSLPSGVSPQQFLYPMSLPQVQYQQHQMQTLAPQMYLYQPNIQVTPQMLAVAPLQQTQQQTFETIPIKTFGVPEQSNQTIQHALMPTMQTLFTSPHVDPPHHVSNVHWPLLTSSSSDYHVSSGAETIIHSKRHRPPSPPNESAVVVRPIPRPSPSPPTVPLYRQTVAIPKPQRIATSQPTAQHQDLLNLNAPPPPPPPPPPHPMQIETPRQSLTSSAFSTLQPAVQPIASPHTSTVTFWHPSSLSTTTQSLPTSNVGQSVYATISSSTAAVTPLLPYRSPTTVDQSASLPTIIAQSTTSQSIMAPTPTTTLSSANESDSASGNQSPSSSSESTALATTSTSLTRSSSIPILSSATSAVVTTSPFSSVSLTPPLTSRTTRQCRHICGCRPLSRTLTLSRLLHHEQNPRVHAKCSPSRPCYIYLRKDAHDSGHTESLSSPPSPSQSGPTSSSSSSAISGESTPHQTFELVHCRHQCGCRAMISSNAKTRYYHESSMALHTNCRPLTMNVTRNPAIAAAGIAGGVVTDGCPMYDRLYNPSQQNLRTLIALTTPNQQTQTTSTNTNSTSTTAITTNTNANATTSTGSNTTTKLGVAELDSTAPPAP